MHSGLGYTVDTEIMTVEGPKQITNVEQDDRLYLVDTETFELEVSPVAEVRTIPNEYSELVEIQAIRCDLLIPPIQPLFMRKRSCDTFSYHLAKDLPGVDHYYFVNDWGSIEGERVDKIDITDFLDGNYEICAEFSCHGRTVRTRLPDGCEPNRLNSHTGYYFDAETFKAHQEALEIQADHLTIQGSPRETRRPYKFDADDFIQFLAWFITEGNTYHGSSKETVTIQITQEDEEHRPEIEDLLDRMGLRQYCGPRNYVFGSPVFGRLLDELCGSGSENKRIPGFIYNICQEQKRKFLETLMKGDGSGRTYYTSSTQLARDLLRLCVDLGYKARYLRRDEMWELYIREVNDGLRPSDQLRFRSCNEVNKLVQFSVDTEGLVMAGRGGRFQWISTPSPE